MLRHFQPYELVDELLYNRLGAACLELFNPEALIALDDFEEFFGKPVIVNNWHAGGQFHLRGYRTKQQCIDLGSPDSQHMGGAFDCTIHAMDAETARRQILADQNNPLLVRITRMEAKVSWVHFDLKALSEGVRRIHLFSA